MKKPVAKKVDLDGFRSWLGEYGLSEGTKDVYVRDVTKALSVGFLDRLQDDELAPKTLRHILAGCRRYAEYTEDDRMLKALKKIKLPAPRRKTAKVPLARTDLFALIDELAKADYIVPVVRAVIGMMACRGLRCGDVLRLRRTELEAAKEAGTLSFEAKGRRRLEFKLLKTYRRYLLALAEMTEPKGWQRVEDVVSPHGAAKTRRSAAARAVERGLVKLGCRIGIYGLYPHRLRRTYAVEYLRAMKGDPEALMKLTQHMQWATMATAMEYVDHARGDELDRVAEQIFERDE